MPIDVDEPKSDGWWLQRLYNRLVDKDRQGRLSLLDDWYRGIPSVPKGSKTQREAIATFAEYSRTNFAKLICEAVRERMTPVGIRTSADNDITGDAEAWRIWLRAGMRVESAEIHRAMFRFGSAYAIVGPPDEQTGVPVITYEDPRQIITEHDPRQQRRRVAALKVFHDDVESADFCYLWLPGRLRVARRDVPRLSNGSLLDSGVTFAADLFNWDEERSLTLPDEDMIPVHRFRNEDGKAEFEPHLDLLRRINHETLQRMTVSVYQAFKQRAAMNLPEKDEDGNVIDYSDVLVSDPGAFWQLPEGVEFWESANIDLSPILNAIKSDVEQLASVTRTPLHYLAASGVNQSAEGAALSREGLVFKTEDRMARCSATWSDVLSDAFLWLRDTERADLDELELIWKPAERESLASRLDAANKATSAQVPWRTIMTDIIGFAPQRVDQMQAERADDQILQAQLLAQTTAITAPAEAAAAAATAKATGQNGGGGGGPKGMAAVNAAKAGTSVPVGNMPAKLQANAQRARTGQRLIGQKT